MSTESSSYPETFPPEPINSYLRTICAFSCDLGFFSHTVLPRSTKIYYFLFSMPSTTREIIQDYLVYSPVIRRTKGLVTSRRRKYIMERNLLRCGVRMSPIPSESPGHILGNSFLAALLDTFTPSMSCFSWKISSSSSSTGLRAIWACHAPGKQDKQSDFQLLPVFFYSGTTSVIRYAAFVLGVYYNFDKHISRMRKTDDTRPPCLLAS